MLALYCQQCGALDDKGVRAHRCASTRSMTPALAGQQDSTIGAARKRDNPKPAAEVVSPALPAATVAITNAITHVEPATLTPKQRAAAWNKANREAYNARQRKLMKERRAAAKAKRD